MILNLAVLVLGKAAVGPLSWIVARRHLILGNIQFRLGSSRLTGGVQSLTL